MVRPARTAKERAQREQHMQKPKATLQDLAYVLRLLLEGINQELVERIDAHLVSNPALAQDRRFESLYTGAKRAEIAVRDSETGRRGLSPQPAGLWT
ncbi:hypothetical protein RHS01_09988 [Rhizoctonia solani]|uniref:Uncharacterized protein n=1 Tax=Rhizoctonia solani TaxID=456999 RepID=A0A8H7I651_9AGAM|nr:hypothetical protein RHS01_09988 [Rhizoctonia solani]